MNPITSKNTTTGRKVTTKGKNAVLQKQSNNSTDTRKCNANGGTTSKSSTTNKKISQSTIPLPPLIDNQNHIKSSKVKNLSKSNKNKTVMSKSSSIFSLLDEDFDLFDD